MNLYNFGVSKLHLAQLLKEQNPPKKEGEIYEKTLGEFGADFRWSGLQKYSLRGKCKRSR
eukprot:1998610-Amphidinium_carterae.1